jgi:hypothetical protein
MGGLIGFILGYYVGAKDGPERLGELRKALEDIAESQDFQALRASLMMMAQQTMGKMTENLSSERNPDGMTPGDAWKTISESEEFRGLISTGTVVLQGVLANVLPQNKGNGHAEQH